MMRVSSYNWGLFSNWKYTQSCFKNGGHLMVKFDSNTGKIWFDCQSSDEREQNLNLKTNSTWVDSEMSFYLDFLKKSEQKFVFCCSVADSEDCITIVQSTKL